MNILSCPALLISAPASGQGKTTVTAALARLHTRLGRKVRVFKCGPDFLDPMILEQASDLPVYQLDLWIQGEDECRRLLWEAAREADLILVEGVMGLFDGSPSSADLAGQLNLPVLAVIDASAMAATFAAVAFGLAKFRTGLPFAGVFANRLGSERHAAILQESVAKAHLNWFGALPKNAEITLPSRHLGLVQAAELADLNARLDAAAKAIAKNLLPQLEPEFDFGNSLKAAQLLALPPAIEFKPTQARHISKLLSGLRIGIARDAAFSFIYQANLDLLAELGAELRFFSPLHDTELPAIDSLYLPGGYPELHLQELHGNADMLDAIRKHQSAQKPILAEGGGMLYLLEKLQNVNGQECALAGLLPGWAVLQKNLVALGAQQLTLPEGVLRGHSFHHSRLETSLPILAQAEYPAQAAKEKSGEAVYRLGRLTASYLHLYFPSNPKATAALFLPQ